MQNVSLLAFKLREEFEVTDRWTDRPHFLSTVALRLYHRDFSKTLFEFQNRVSQKKDQT